MPLEKVKGYIWKSGKLKGKKASPYVRPKKPSRQIGVHRAETVYLKQTRSRDNQGRVVNVKTVRVKGE